MFKYILLIIVFLYTLFILDKAYGKDYNTMYPRTQKVIDLGHGICGECCNCTIDQKINIGGFMWYSAETKRITIMEELYSFAGGGARKYSFVYFPYPRVSKAEMFYIEMLAYQIIYADKVRLVEDRILSLGAKNYVRDYIDDLKKGDDDYQTKPRWVKKMKTVYRDGVHNWKK